MERSKFIQAFHEASCQLDKKKLRNITKRAIVSNSKIDSERDYLIIMEELAELSQQASKAGRGRCDKIGLIEEMADVVLCLVRLQELCDVETLDLYKAINVKVDRLERVLNEKGVYL